MTLSWQSVSLTMMRPCSHGRWIILKHGFMAIPVNIHRPRSLLCYKFLCLKLLNIVEEKFVWHVCYCFIMCFSFQNISWVSIFQLTLVFKDTLDENSFVNLCCEFSVPNPRFAFCNGDTMPICLSLSHNHTYIEMRKREFHFALCMLWELHVLITKLFNHFEIWFPNLQCDV